MSTASLDSFTFRRLSEDDLEMLWEWRNRPHVAEVWGTYPTLDEVRAKYLPRIAEDGEVAPYVARLGGVPVGYIQSYVAIESPGGWWVGQHDRGVIGIDLFLADGDRLGRGLGTAMVAAFVRHLFSDPAVHTVQLDPAPDNPRAIRCYEKVGFRKVRELTTPDGPAVLMTVDRESLAAP